MKLDRRSKPPPNEPGLRRRKKAQRRQEILRCAEHLFAQDGVEAATMAAIAERAGISPPTVFNYFGSKENILVALITEGAERERLRHLNQPRQTGCHFAHVLGDLVCELTENTMRIAGRRIWRYAEAANIRRPGSAFETQFAHSNNELFNLIIAFLGAYDIKLRNGKNPDTNALAAMFLDRWNARYLEYIKDESMPMAGHYDILRSDIDTMVSLLFDDAFAARSPLLKAKEAQ